MTYTEVPVIASRSSNPARLVRRVQFVRERPDAAIVLRTYEEPRPTWAIDAGSAPTSSATAPGEPNESCVLTLLSPGGSPTRAVGEVDARVVVARRGHETIEWRPGAANVRCDKASEDEVVPAVIDFAFLERELRSLEQFLKRMEPQAQLDLPPSHQLNPRDRSRWADVARRYEEVAAARLAFARLEPQFSIGTRDLSVAGRSWFTRLCRRDWIEDRLEAANDRLEALEDFYEASTQRISDYRWYREGHLLETGIIGILLVECLLMLGDIFVHLHR